MRSFTIAAAAASLISSAYAAPWGHGGLWGGKPVDPTKCLTLDSATYLADGFKGLIAAYTPADADRLLADDLVDFSNSILSLQGLPTTGAPVFPTKAAFEAGQGSQPPVPFTVVSIDAYNCQNVTFRWTADFPKSVNGITHLVASNTQGQKDTWQIKTIYTEFDSITWLLAIGGSINPPPRN